jgi:3',5'-cyclic-AMP phosphodiesterase
MPIHLAPLSRRRFISRSLAAGAGLVFGPKLLGAGPPTDENTWALLADVHIAADRAKINQDVNMTDNLAGVVRELAALPARPAAVLVNGDCAFNRGEKDDYAALTSLLEPLRKNQMPVHLALGNHDHRERFWQALAEEKAAKRPVADRQTAWLRSPRANWFVLDSLEKTLATPGWLGPEQLAWLAGVLDANRDQPALIVAHHNPGTVAGVAGIKDTEEFFKIIRPRKQVKAFIFGHTHRWSVTRDESGIHLINLPPVAYSFHKGDPSGWVQATIASDGMRLELRCVDQSHKAHGQVNELKWRA